MNLNEADNEIVGEICSFGEYFLSMTILNDDSIFNSF